MVSAQPFLGHMRDGFCFAMGSPSPGRAAVAVPFYDVIELWRVTGPTPVLVDTFSASMTESEYVIAACLDDVGAIRTDDGWWFTSAGSPWTVTASSLSIGDVDRLTIAGDKSCAVAQTDAGDVVGVPMDGSGSPLWTCSLGAGMLLGSPRADRWLRLTGDWPSTSIELINASGSVLDSIAYDHPEASYSAPSGGPGPEDSTVHACPVAAGVVTLLGKVKYGFANGDPLSVAHRTLLESSDVLAWNAATAEITGWTEDALTRYDPWGAACDGQIAIGARLVTFA